MKNKGKNWVDYKEIKEKVNMEMVLAHYGVLPDLKESGKNLVGCCPIHKGSNPRQFSVNTERNIFNCFGNCKSGGNVLDFVSKMEDISIRDAGLLLKKLYLADSPPNRPAETSKKKLAKKKRTNKESKPDPPSNPDPEVNPALNFQLKSLEPEHAFFEEREIKPKTIQHFGLGFCARGMMKNRIAIPIHDERGQLVAYCGRAINDQQIEDEGKYKLPPNFLKSAVCYNLNRQKKSEKTLILVESFLSVFWLFQNGFPNTVALMGSVLSERQEELIAEFLGPDGLAILIFDGDEDGQKCTEDCLLRLGRKVFVKAVDVEIYAKKPHQLTPKQTGRLLR